MQEEGILMEKEDSEDLRPTNCFCSGRYFLVSIMTSKIGDVIQFNLQCDSCGNYCLIHDMEIFYQCE